jgi:hypothetical protein
VIETPSNCFHDLPLCIAEIAFKGIGVRQGEFCRWASQIDTVQGMIANPHPSVFELAYKEFSSVRPFRFFTRPRDQPALVPDRFPLSIVSAEQERATPVAPVPFGAPATDCSAFATGIEEVTEDDTLGMEMIIHDVGECAPEGPSVADKTEVSCVPEANTESA